MGQQTATQLLLLSLLLSVAPSLSMCSPPPSNWHQIQARQGSGATSTITIMPSSTPSVSPDLTDETFTSAVLNSSNTYRAQHGASDFRWNKTLEDFASEYLDKVAPKPDTGDKPPQCKFEHSGGPYGENLAIGCNSAAGCVEAWGDERKLGYPFGAADGFSMETGHFSQLVWKNTSDVGCARRECAGDKGYTRGWYLVCEYWPRGNVGGQYAQMVGNYEGSEPLGGGGDRLGGDFWRVLVVGGMVVGLLW
ncbi:CAP domain-containing protein [Microdochium bolleyi]|uniref:CAP domain-containing protein n=1 Tax=Microdochium bolleyi TaxID=196109 RepID=A0A136JGB2_9PEZI|nr:CAP domain-containing protein [Microdochium bolleyi]